MDKTIALVIAIVVSCISISVYAIEDWTFELTDRAKKAYMEKVLDVSCNNIEQMLNDKEYDALFNIIRDIALVDNKRCEREINYHMKRLKQNKDLSGVILFYKFKRTGKTKYLKEMTKIFDSKYPKVGDHWIVEIFGYLADWKETGVRLVLRSKNADGSGGELLCSSIKWKRYLFGEERFRKLWFKYGEQKNVPIAILSKYYKMCHP